jgi:PAS domain S-box-containing protein
MNIPKKIFHITAQAAVDAIILINEKGRVVFWNKASENMFGYSSSEILGKSVHEVIMPEEYVEQYRKGFETFQKTGKGKVVDKVLELEALRKSGERFPIEITVAPIKRKNKYWAVAIIRDITKKNTLIKTLSGLYYATERIGDPLTLTNRAYEVVKM